MVRATSNVLSEDNDLGPLPCWRRQPQAVPCAGLMFCTFKTSRSNERDQEGVSDCHHLGWPESYEMTWYKRSAPKESIFIC